MHLEIVERMFYNYTTASHESADTNEGRRSNGMNDRTWLEQEIARLMQRATDEELDLLWRFLKTMVNK